MSTYTETAEKLQSPVLDGIKQLQATNLEMVANFSKSAGALVPKTPELPVGYDPKQFIEKSFDFTNQHPRPAEGLPDPADRDSKANGEDSQRHRRR